MLKPFFETELGKLYQGDALDIIPELDEKVDLVITDPPYNPPAKYYNTRKNYPKTLSDFSILENYFNQFFNILAPVLTHNSVLYCFCDGQSYPLFYVKTYPIFKSVRPLIWDKMTAWTGYTWRHQHEIICFCESDDSPVIKTGDGDIIRCPAVKADLRSHPAEKPVQLIEKLISKHKANVTLDPFLGSGTTAIACEKLKRHWIGIEISKEYCEVAATRLQQATAQLSML